MTRYPKIQTTLTDTELDAIRRRAHEGTDALAVRDRGQLLAELDRIRGEDIQVEITHAIGQPSTCTVHRYGIPVFRGRSY